MFGEKQEQENEFKKKRQEFSENIRRANREQKFNKRRNLEHDHFDLENLDQDDQEKYDRQIIDLARYDQLIGICNTQFSENQLPNLIQALSSQDIYQKHYAIIGIRKLLAIEVDPPIQNVIDQGLIPTFMELAKQNTFPQLKLEAVWCMTNIASGTRSHCKSLVQKGAMQLFLLCLKENQKGVIDQAIWAVGNLAADDTKYRDEIINRGGLSDLVKVIQTTNNKTIIKNGTWSLTNLCRGAPLPNYNKVKEAVPVLCKVLKSGFITDKQVLSDLCWALSYMSEGSKSRIQRVLQEGVLNVLFTLAKSSYHMLSSPALRTIGNFSTGNQLQTQELLKNGILDLSVQVLGHVKKTMRRQMCWIISNIVVGPSNHVEAFLAHKALITKLVQLFEKDLIENQKQICWIFANLGHSGNIERVIGIFQQFELMKYYVNLLGVTDQDTLENALETLFKVLMYGDKCKINGTNILLKMFENYGGAQKLEGLQYHQSKDIYEQTISIIQTFFNTQTEEFDM